MKVANLFFFPLENFYSGLSNFLKREDCFHPLAVEADVGVGVGLAADGPNLRHKRHYHRNESYGGVKKPGRDILILR